MEIFVHLLQGSYAYFLIFQILLISALFLVLIGLIVHRTKEAALWEGQPAESPTASLPLPATTTSEGATAATAPEGGAEAPAAETGASPEENKALAEKVRFLESKLLEYEILQEEIGTLSALKLENEHLRKKLGSPAPPKKEASEPPLPTIIPAEPSSAPELGLDSTTDAKIEPAFDETLDKALIFDGPKPPAEPLEPTAPTEPSANLESLLEQIDELTKRSPDLAG
jgi:hypothetical protein